jgi:hypothetical protein
MNNLANRYGARLGFLALSLFAFFIGWLSISFIFIACAILGYFRVCGIMRNAWCGILPYKLWSEEKPQDYLSYKNHLFLRLKSSLRFLLFRETMADISLQDSFQVSFSDYFGSEKCGQYEEKPNQSEDEYSYLYGSWKESNPNAWKE